jgi:2-desacetyl-2-hydroxyethyl bacteriochlorophyllide A dehydrogenase
LTESTASHMQVALAREIPTRRLDLAAVERPQVRADDDVLVRVEACGICGTDLHILEGGSYRPDLPFVLGHEPVGLVVEAGAAAGEWIDRRVTMTLFTGDGTCRQCRTGDQRLCPHLVSITGVLGVWGGYAEFVRVHAAQLLPAPDVLTPSATASLVDCGATAANAVRVTREHGRPSRVLVLGAGPIGFMASELLRIDGIPLQVVQPSPLRREAIARLGHDTVSSVAEAEGPFDAVIDCTGVAGVMMAGLDALGPQGIYVLAGYARVPDIDFAVVARKELTIRGTRSGRREDLQAALELAASGEMRLPEILEWPLSEVNDALEALRAKQVPGKAVVVPDQVMAKRLR